MKFSLIICTYKRRQAIEKLLNSVKLQTLYPDEILVVDGSTDNETKDFLETAKYKNLKYYKVDEQDRGLTKQRNFGIAKVSDQIQIVCFLDDDTILSTQYFENLINTYKIYPQALGVGGYITNEVEWKKIGTTFKNSSKYFSFDGYIRSEPLRFKIRKKIGLDTNVPPGKSPMFSHGRSVSFLPPSGKIYNVEQLMGGVSSFKKTVFLTHQFSTYFEGYGLYEDADFSIRLAKTGNLYLNTAAGLEHHHDAAGRPNKYQYGKMVVRNGWYVWRVKNDSPKLIDHFKWNAITLLLILIRAANGINSNKKQEVYTETIGRLSGWFSLLINKPKVEN